MSSLIFNCAVAALIGQLIHIFVVKIPSLQTRFRKAKVPFSVKEFFKAEWVTMVGNLFAIIGLLWTLDETLNIRPEILVAIKWLFLFVGFTGSSIVLSVFSKTGKYLNNIIDLKTGDEKTE